MPRILRTALRPIALAVTIVLTAALGGCAISPTQSAPAPFAAELEAAVTHAMDEYDLRAVILTVYSGQDERYTAAFGEAMAGVPATSDMHFRNGAIAIALMATAALRLVDDGVLALDDTIDAWVPDVPHADQVTVEQLIRMTSGYQDYVAQPEFQDAVLADPFRVWTPQELLALAVDLPLHFEPGTNWSYAHTNYVLLGLVIEAATGRSLDAVMRELVLDPLELDETGDPGSAWLPEPALHAFTPERAGALGVTMPGFVEDSTSWNPSWTLARGAIQFTDIHDAAMSMRAVVAGTLLSDELHALQLSRELQSFTHPAEGCPTCFTHDERYTFGMGVVLTGEWVIQTPLFFGWAGAAGALRAEDLSIAVAVTYRPQAYVDGGTTNRADTILRTVAGIVAPEHAPPPAHSR